MLITSSRSTVSISREPIWPEGSYSALSGFVEAAESLEGVRGREWADEGDVRTISKLGSHPWPFPRSLTIGFSTVAAPEQSLRLQEGEIENTRWGDPRGAAAEM